MATVTTASSSTDLKRIKSNEISVDPNRPIVTHPTQEVTNEQAMSIISGSPEVSTVVNHYISQTTSVPQSTSIGYIGDINAQAYVRQQKIDFVNYNMRPNRRVFPFFDGKDVTNIIQKPNIVELDNSASYVGLNNTNVNDLNNNVIDRQINLAREKVFFGASGNVFAEVYFSEKTETGNTRLYISEIISDNTSSLITAGMTVRSGQDRNTLSGIRSNVVSYKHQSGVLAFNTEIPGISQASNVYFSTAANTYTTANTLFFKKLVTLSDDASSTENYYVGNTITVVNGMVPGETSKIVSYNGSSKIAIVEPGFLGLWTIGRDDPTQDFIYTIGDSRSPHSVVGYKNTLYTTSKGYLGGSLYIPPPWMNTTASGYNFRVGEKLFKITDNDANNSEDATTIAEYVYNTFGLSIARGQLTIDYFSNEIKAPGFPDSPPVRGGILTPLPAPGSVGGLITANAIQEVAGTKPTRSVKSNPMAQSFFVSEIDHPKGFYIPYIDVFFRSKGTLGIEMQIRPVVNGYPDSKNILPNAISYLDADNVKTSELPSATDAATYTRFVFKSPVYVLPGQEYCFVLSTNDYDYDIYVAELGETAIGSNRRISEQPYLGSLFKSQNSSVYDAIQSEDLMFVIHKCQFIGSGFMEFHEEKSLTPVNGLFNYYFDGNTSFDTFQVHSNIIKLPDTDITFNFKSTTESTGTLDAEYQVFKPDGRVLLGNRRVVTSPVFSDESFKLRVDLSTTNRDISPIIFKNQMRLYTGKVNINNMSLRSTIVSVANSGAGYTSSNTSVLIGGSSDVSANAIVRIKFQDFSEGRIEGLHFDNLGSGYYDDITVNISSTTGAGANVSVESETGVSGGPGIAKYISKTVTLAPEFDAGDLRVYLTAIRPQGSEILVYYKIKNPYDEDEIDSKNWVRMQRVTGKIEFSSSFEPIEYEYRPSLTSNSVVYSSTTGTFDSFNQFKIKIVLASESTSLDKIPYVYDMRAVALPADGE